MIDIRIQAKGSKIAERVDHKLCTLGEVSLVVYRLEQIKKILIEKDFEADFKMEEK